MRADAARNRQRILDAAEEVFAFHGVSVPVDVVAASAGVGVGTFYRHFPTKESLFEAIVVARIDRLLLAAAAEGADPVDSFYAFLRLLGDEVSAKHDLVDALGSAGVDLQLRCQDKFDQLKAALDRLRRRAVDSGGIRADIGTEQVLALVVGTCMGADKPNLLGSERDLMLQVVFDGLRRRV